MNGVREKEATTFKMQWLEPNGPRRSAPYKGDCQHKGVGHAVGLGSDDKHYKLTECGDCGSRAWQDYRGTTTTQWMGSA
jgi:hypothetical protein